MRFAFFLSLMIFALNLGAQPEPKPTSFHFEFDLLATHPTMVKEEGDLKSRFDLGGGLNFSVRRKISPLVSLEAGIGLQQYTLRQRNENILLGCDIDNNINGLDAPASHLDAEILLASATLHFAPIIHFGQEREGMYLKPKIRFNYNIGDSADGNLYECSNDDPTAVGVGHVSGNKLTVFPGLGLGYQIEGERKKFSYIEVNLAMSAGNTFTKGDDEDEFSPLLSFWKESGALICGVTIGWQIGGGTKKRRRVKKEQPAPVLGYYSGK
jgi:hypothetical protein